jgi:two-component system chemotaxis response regulator CheY
MSEPLTEQVLAKRVADAIRMTFDGPVTAAQNYSTHLPRLSDGRVVTVPLIGTPNLLVSLRVNESGGLALATAMFGCSKKLTTAAMIDDALCELANMVAGQIKALTAREHQIGVPSVLQDEASIVGARAFMGTRLHVGDTESEVDVAIADFQPEMIDAVASLAATVPTILLAEDDAVTLAFLKAAVQSAGMNVVAESRNGQQALEDIRRLRPAVACLDINMPEMTGLEVLAVIRKEMPGAIVFLISSFATAENVREAIRLRANGIIVKPFVKARIVGEIEKALSQRQNA